MNGKSKMNTTVTIWRMHLRSLRNAICYETRMRIALGVGLIFSTIFGVWSASQLLLRLHQWQLQGPVVLDTGLWFLCWYTWIGMIGFTVIGCVQRALGDDEAMVLFSLPIPPATRFRALYGTFFIENLWNWLLLEIGVTGYVLLVALGWNAFIWLAILQLGTAVAVLCTLLSSLLAIRYLIARERVKTRKIVASVIALLLVTLFALRGKLTVHTAISWPRPTFIVIVFVLLLAGGLGPLAKPAGKLYLTVFSITQSWDRSRKGTMLPGIRALTRAFARRRTLTAALFVKMLLSQSRNFIAWGRLCMVLIILLLFPPLHTIAQQAGWPNTLFVVCFAAGLAFLTIMEQAVCAISGEANRLTLYLIAPCELATFLRAKLLLFSFPILLQGMAIGLFLAWQIGLTLSQAAFALVAIVLILVGALTLLICGSTWGENPNVTVEGTMQTVFQEEVPATPQRIWLLNLGTTAFVAMILLLWKLPPVPALIALVVIDMAIITSMWHFGQAQLRRVIRKG